MSHVPAETKMASVQRTDEAPMPRNFSNSTLPPLSSDQLFKCTRCQVDNNSIDNKNCLSFYFFVWFKRVSF